MADKAHRRIALAPPLQTGRRWELRAGSPLLMLSHASHSDRPLLWQSHQSGRPKAGCWAVTLGGKGECKQKAVGGEVEGSRERERERNKNKQRGHAEASCFSPRCQLGFKQPLNNMQQQFLREEGGLGFGIKTAFTIVIRYVEAFLSYILRRTVHILLFALQPKVWTRFEFRMT